MNDFDVEGYLQEYHKPESHSGTNVLDPACGFYAVGGLRGDAYVRALPVAPLRRAGAAGGRRAGHRVG
jgi:hypothetical protein